jgi:hypothetical protein
MMLALYTGRRLSRQAAPSDAAELPKPFEAYQKRSHMSSLFWAGSAADRISVLERTVASEQAAIAQVAVLEEQVREMEEQLSRIEGKLDRMQPAATKP